MSDITNCGFCAHMDPMCPVCGLPPPRPSPDFRVQAARRLVTGLESLRARSTGSKASVFVEDLHELIRLAEWLADKLEEKAP